MNQYFSPEDGFDVDEARLPPRDLYRLLKRKIMWAEEERDMLEEEKKRLEEKRRQSWVKKELMVDKVLKFELKDDADDILAA